MSFLHGMNRHSLTAMLLASIGAILFGFDNGWWGTALGSPTFLRDYGACVQIDGVETCSLSTGQLSAGSSVQSAGIMVASLAAAYINNWVGRRRSLVITAIVSLIGVIIQITSAAGSKARFSQLVVGKTVASLSMGMVANVIPIYLSETSPAAARGFGISLYQNIQVIGVIVASGAVYATSTRLDKSAYLIPIGVQAVAPGVMLLVSPWLPESPRWLVWKRRNEEAVVAAGKLFGTTDPAFDARDYCDKLQAAFEEEHALARSTGWSDLLSGPDLRRALIAIGIQSLQQGQGSSYMNNYVVSFLQGAGVVNVFPVIMGLYCLYWAAILTGHFLPDMVGRRIIVMATAWFCGACLIIVAIITTLRGTSLTPSMQKANIALIFLWETSFGIQSPLVWIITAEAAPTRNREKVLSLATFFGFGVSLLIASVSPYLQNPGYGNLGSRIGFIWGSFSIVTAIWTFFFVPETKGLSLEQLDYLYANKVPTRRFKGYHFTDEILASGVATSETTDLPIDDDEKASVKDQSVSVTRTVSARDV